MRPTTIRARVLTAGVLALLIASGPIAGVARGAPDRSGTLPDAGSECSELDRADFDALGEETMDRMMGSRAAHDAMDRMMFSTQGEQGMQAMHESIGRRMTGCGGGDSVGQTSMGPMMSMMGGVMGEGPGGRDTAR